MLGQGSWLRFRVDGPVPRWPSLFPSRQLLCPRRRRSGGGRPPNPGDAPSTPRPIRVDALGPRICSSIRQSEDLDLQRCREIQSSFGWGGGFQKLNAILEVWLKGTRGFGDIFEQGLKRGTPESPPERGSFEGAPSVGLQASV